MKFQVAKRDLETALKVVTPSLASNVSDLSAHFLFRLVPPAKDGDEVGVEVLTYSGRVSASCPLKAKVLEGDEGAFSIEGKRLRQWLNYVEDAALEFVFDDSVTTAKAPKGSQKFQSLDPAQFPYWDKQIDEAKVTGTLPAARLARAMDYAKDFVSSNESGDPNLCVIEVRDGILWATDRKAITLIRVTGLESVGFRTHSKNIGKFLAFLGTFSDDTEVEILEHDRTLFMRRGDGAIFGEAVFQARFPDLKINLDEENHHTWTVGRASLLNSIGFLTSGASWEENRIRVSARGDKMVLSMSNETGDKTELVIDAEMESVEDAEAIPDEGFDLDHECFGRILSAWRDLDEMKMGVNIMRLGDKRVLRGYVRFMNDVDGDKYLTIHSFLR